VVSHLIVEGRGEGRTKKENFHRSFGQEREKKGGLLKESKNPYEQCFKQKGGGEGPVRPAIKTKREKTTPTMKKIATDALVILGKYRKAKSLNGFATETKSSKHWQAKKKER